MSDLNLIVIILGALGVSIATPFFIKKKSSNDPIEMKYVFTSSHRKFDIFVENKKVAVIHPGKRSNSLLAFTSKIPPEAMILIFAITLANHPSQ